MPVPQTKGAWGAICDPNTGAIVLPPRKLPDEMIRGIREAAEAINRNAAALPMWSTETRSERERILMELRHALSGALKCVQILQERLDADQRITE